MRLRRTGGVVGLLGVFLITGDVCWRVRLIGRLLVLGVGRKGTGFRQIVPNDREMFHW